MKSSSSKRQNKTYDNGDTYWGRVLMKFKKLATLMENFNPSIDDPELRWVEHQIEKLESDGRYSDQEVTRNDLLQGNVYWKKYQLMYNNK